MPAQDEAPNTPRRDVILIADASSEGQTIALALRARGFAVAFSPIERLEARVLHDAPRVLLVDIDEPGARDAIERLRELPEGDRIELICFGNPARAAEVGASSAQGRAFARPLDIHTIIAQTAALADPAPLEDSIVDEHGAEIALRVGETIPPGGFEDGSGSFPAVFQSAFPGAPEGTEMGGSIFPPDESDGQSPPTLLPTHPMQLSPDLMGLLASAEQRVLAEIPNAGSIHPVAVGIDDDMDIVLSDEFLAILEEPLDADDEAPASGANFAQSGAIDPGTGPNALLGVTTSALAALSISDANPAAAAGLLGQTETPAVFRDPNREQRSPVTPRRPTLETRGAALISSSAPRISEPRQSLLEGPATAWDPKRSARSVDESRTPVRISEPAMSAPKTPRTDRKTLTNLSTSPSPAMRLDTPTAESRVDLAPPTVIPARLAARWAVQSGAPNSSGRGGFSPPTAPSVLASRSSMDPPPSVRLAPPVPPPPAPTSSTPGTQTQQADLPVPSRRFLASASGAASLAAAAAAAAASAAASSSGIQAPVLGPGDASRALARAIASRATGALAFHEATTTRRVLLHDGDMVTASSNLPEESLTAFLCARGDVERDIPARLYGKIPASGRHAGAALIAHGFLAQDALWSVLRAHAEWLIGRALAMDAGTLDLEIEPPARLRAEPSVFGGATGAEVFVEVTRRITPPELAIQRLGGPQARLDAGPRNSLLPECALAESEVILIGRAPSQTITDLVEQAGAEITSLLWALVCLEVLSVLVAARTPTKEKPRPEDPLDEEAIRMRVRARLALVEDGDYFALLGLTKNATAYEIRRAYLDLRRTFEPERLLTKATADLITDTRLILEVLDEAYEILKDTNRRERYRRAIEAGPP